MTYAIRRYYHFHVIEPCASLVAECIKNAGGAAHLDAKRMLEEGISAFRGSTHNGELVRRPLCLPARLFGVRPDDPLPS